MTVIDKPDEVYPPIPVYGGRWTPPKRLLDCYNYMWIDTDAWEHPENVTFELYSQPTRGPGAQGSYLVVLPPGYNDLDLGTMPKVILVAPQALPEGRWTNSYDDSRRLRDIMRHNLVTAIDEQYRTIRHPSARWLEGHSAGGYGAFNLGLKYPDVCGGALSPLAGSFRTELAKEGLKITYDTYNGSQAFFTSNHALTLLKGILPRVHRDKPELQLLVGGEGVRLREEHEHMWTSLYALGVPYTKANVPGAPPQQSMSWVA
ncbi:hypothetical protein BO83DRAFT_445604 [Aspergillus eucalypticola CBS 122712]|uniref:Alpha/beta-hydrolase n=1 Tax=Aspergillus eucalypticola (strain CBS 122712 / IBT 29274) TaxID=1448314 RepID=A0A317VDY6_ASPEC|nr:uncharacterized protein BO83DRAFT_445604 [Aspergillus eucalypticola CBS 122712]PWY72583.1 hypothetical protein BO83DRAFT_445604 [Aspergillus eucalypticola CBS 122712]